MAVWSVAVGASLLALAGYAVYGVHVIPRALAAFLPYPDALVAIAGLICLVEVAVAIGLWSLRPWGRRLAIAFALAGIAFGLVTLPVGVVSALLSLGTIWYLNDSDVRAAFREPGVPAK